LIAKPQALDKITDQRSKIRGGDLQDLARGDVARLGSRSNDGKHSGKYVVRSREGAGLQLLPGGEVQFTENAIAKRRVPLLFLERAHSHHHCTAADIVGAAFITEQRSVATDTHNLTGAVAADGSRTGSGKQNDYATVTGSFESEFEVGADSDEGSREFLGKQSSHSFGGFRLTGTGIAGADSSKIVDGNTGGLKSEARTTAHGGHGAAKTDAHGIGRATAALREDAALCVDEDAVSFGPAAVKTESQFHETRIRERRSFRSVGVTKLQNTQRWMRNGR
jgi:hypothetical protein